MALPIGARPPVQCSGSPQCRAECWHSQQDTECQQHPPFQEMMGMLLLGDEGDTKRQPRARTRTGASPAGSERGSSELMEESFGGSNCSFSGRPWGRQSLGYPPRHLKKTENADMGLLKHCPSKIPNAAGSDGPELPWAWQKTFHQESSFPPNKQH